MADEASAADLSLANAGKIGAPAAKSRLPRYAIVDAARGAALVAMICYHFTWDLDFFGLIPSGVSASLLFQALGHAIAAIFLAIVGVGLVLAGRDGFNARSYARRLATIVGAALLITVATWIIFPHEYIFFGILDCIAVSSLVAALFIERPAIVTFAVAAVAAALPFVAANPAFNAPALQWLGLGTQEPVTNDWAPFLPGFGAVLFGVGWARVALTRGVPERVANWTPERIVPRLLVRGGRRSLIVYLAHQPILLGILFVATIAVGRGPPNEAQAFVRKCSAQCAAHGAGQTYCDRVCGCVATRAQPMPLWRHVLENRLSPDERDRFNAIARECVRAIGP